MNQQKAICKVPVHIYDEDLRGEYAVGQEVPIALAERYPQFFEFVKEEGDDA